MIPKRLIFIWIGNDVPEYGKHCMKTFSQVNPDFEIMFVHEKDLNNPQNYDVVKCQELVNSTEYNIYKHMTVRPYVKNHMMNDIGRITAFSDALRLYLLNKYGGIYLDLDTFPIKPFDQKILSYENGFSVNHEKKRCDYFFMGFESGCVEKCLIRYKLEYGKGQIFDNRVHRIKYPEEMLRALSFKVKRNSKMLNDGILTFGDRLFRNDINNEYYIDHYRIGAWKK